MLACLCIMDFKRKSFLHVNISSDTLRIVLSAYTSPRLSFWALIFYCNIYLYVCMYVLSIHNMAITLKAPAQHCVNPPFVSNTALTCQVMDHTGPLKVCCTKTLDPLCPVGCDTEPPWITGDCLPSTSHRHSFRPTGSPVVLPSTLLGRY